jgi:hypothetical protein
MLEPVINGGAADASDFRDHVDRQKIRFLVAVLAEKSGHDILPAFSLRASGKPFTERHFSRSTPRTRVEFSCSEAGDVRALKLGSLTYKVDYLGCQ